LHAARKPRIPASEFLLVPDVWKVECDLFAVDTKLGGLVWLARRQGKTSNCNGAEAWIEGRGCKTGQCDLQGRREGECSQGDLFHEPHQALSVKSLVRKGFLLIN